MSTSRSERLNEKSKPAKNETETPVIETEQQPEEGRPVDEPTPDGFEDQISQEEFENQISQEEFEQQEKVIENYNANFSEMLAKETPLEEMNEVTGSILTRKLFADGEKKPFIFTGFTEISDVQTGEPRKAAMLTGKDGQYYAPSQVIVSACEKITETPKRIDIVSLGMKEGKTNSYWNVKIYTL